MRAVIAASKRLRSPMKRTRTPRRWSSPTSRSSALRNSFISAPTSSAGRPQFSLEKANRVRASTPRSRQKSMHRFTARAPARWPITRGRWRRAAQRPLPSMMMATWRGMHGGADSAFMPTPSDRHQLLFLGLDHLVDVLDRVVGDLLHLALEAALVVLADGLVLQQLFRLLVGVAADVADRDLGRFALGVDHLGQLAAAFLGQRGQVDADRGAGGVGRQAEVGGEDGLFDRGDHGLFPGRDGERADIADGHRGHLRQRHVRPVVVDLQVVDQGRGRAPGADLGQVVPQRFHALRHACLRVLLDLVEHRLPVPVRNRGIIGDAGAGEAARTQAWAPPWQAPSPRSTCSVAWLMPKRACSASPVACTNASSSSPRGRTRCAVIATPPAPRDQTCRWWTETTPGRPAMKARTSAASMPGGTASIAALKPSRSRPMAPTATTTPTSSAVAGSSQAHPRASMPAPATTVAREIAASAMRCR